MTQIKSLATLKGGATPHELKASDTGTAEAYVPYGHEQREIREACNRFLAERGLLRKPAFGNNDFRRTA